MALHLAEIALTVAPGAHAVVLMDQAGWHTTGKLEVPDNISIIPLPAKCPELNPVENIWQFMRETWLSNRAFCAAALHGKAPEGTTLPRPNAHRSSRLAKPGRHGHNAPGWCQSTSLNSGSLLQKPRTSDLGSRQSNPLIKINLISDQALKQASGLSSKTSRPIRQ